ncbi:kinase-like protein [Xylaria sp. FL0043]|nr:kinase-like protein [Xylaria sp. FL0043]
MAENEPPMYTDTPLSVMHTPQFQTGNTDPFTVEASKMALSHNAFIRGFNSIYQQAPRVPLAHKSDFVGYCLAWHDCVEAHHRYEETDFFPNVNKAAGTTGLMEGAVQEHALFHDGLGRFNEYLRKEGAAFSASHLIEIMDSFKDPLHSHLQSEPPMIVALAQHSTPQHPIDIARIAESAATKPITVSVLFNMLPVFYLNMNPAEFEDASSDSAPAPSASKKAEVLIVTLDGLIVAADSRTRGFGNLADENRWHELNVSTPATLFVYLVGRNKTPLIVNRFTSPWSTKLNLSFKPLSSSRQLVHLEADCGTIFLRLCYTEQGLPPFEQDREWECPDPIGCTDLLRTQKRLGYHGVNQHYAMKVVENANTPAEFKIVHSFIAPLQFSLRTPDKLRLFSPMADGGYLFSHLQKYRRFNVFLARFFTAQLICIIECLHDYGITSACLRPEHITVDAFAHISLCRPDLFILDPQKKDNVLPGTPEIAAPELLLCQEPSRATDWWSLGIFLHEMLTGLLPFYHKDPERYRHKITSEELTVAASVSSDAADILMRLLEKDYTKRLGVNGASEVKAHTFFQDIDWNELLPQPSVTRLEICDTNMIYKSSDDSGVRGNIRKQIQISGIKYMEESFDIYRWWNVTGRVRNEMSGNMGQSNVAQQDRNELEVNEQTTNFNPWWPFTTASNQPTVTDTNIDTTLSTVPSELQKKYALASALKFNCSSRDIEQILESPINLNFAILEYYNYAVDPSVSLRQIDGRVVFSEPGEMVMLTPLEWAVEHGNTDLVNLFLAKGADASYTVEVQYGPALVKAVSKGDQRLVEILAKHTNRVSSTRALSKAVALQDEAMVKTLISAGVRCDFERADVMRVRASMGCDFSAGPTPLGMSDYVNPLAIAARAGDAALVRLLLAHGADANADYHDLRPWVIEHEDGVETVYIGFVCGRPVQIAMELGHSEVVRVLLEEGGADIWAPHPVSRSSGHKCAVLAWEVYVRVTAELEEAAAVVRRHTP